MSQFVDTSLAWAKRNLAWSNSRESWQERFGLAGLVFAAVLLLAFREHVPLPLEVLLWAGLLLGASLLTRRGWLRLFGPMLFYDLVRVGRHVRYFYMRTLYALGLGLLLCWMYITYRVQTNDGRLDRVLMAEFANTFFETFIGVQFVVLMLLTPAYTAGAIADEKDRRTLEFLLATDLRNREIVLSKLMSRIANLGLLILTGLPVLSFVQFLGGVDPNLVFAGYAVTILTVISLAALSIFNSVMSKKARDAITMTYLGGLAYLILSGASWFLLMPTAGLAGRGIDALGISITVQDCVETLNAGNPIAGVIRLLIEVDSGKHVTDVLGAILRSYAIFHVLLILICCTWSIARVRGIALRENAGKQLKRARHMRYWRRPAVGNSPMLWKELVIERGPRLNIFGRILICLLMIASFVPAILIIWLAVFSPGKLGPSGGVLFDPNNVVSTSFNVWVRIVGMLVACLLLLAIASRAASSISSERDRQTLDALLTSPLDIFGILFAKWFGNIASVRSGCLWLGAIYATAIVMRGLSLAALPLLVLAWLTYAGALSCIGMWYSIACRTSLRATVWTFLTVAAAGVGHWLIWMCFVPFMILMQQSGSVDKWFQWLGKFQTGLTPPAVLSYHFAFHENEIQNGNGVDFVEVVGIGMIGVAFWMIVTILLWIGVYLRFASVTGRKPWAQTLSVPPRSAEASIGSTT
jgi:ABC-type transport system involved in multi-copper enzyme maturation permease subunit